MRGKSEGKIICPKCGEFGRLEVQTGSIYRINHDVMKKGKKSRFRCYFGSLSKSLENLKRISITRDDIIDPGLISELELVIEKNRKEHFEKIKNSDYGTLIAKITRLSQILGLGWGSKRHYLVKQDGCPHCHKPIQHRFERIGELKDGKYNIDHYSIEKSSPDHTSRMK